MIGRQIVFLPDEAVEHMGVIGHVIEEFGGGEPVALQHHFRFEMGHFQSPFPCLAGPVCAH